MSAQLLGPVDMSPLEFSSESSLEQKKSTSGPAERSPPSTRCPSPTESATTTAETEELALKRKDLEELGEALSRSVPEAWEEALPCACCVRKVLLGLEDRRQASEASTESEFAEALSLWNRLAENAEEGSAVQNSTTPKTDAVSQLIEEVARVLSARVA